MRNKNIIQSVITMTIFIFFAFFVLTGCKKESVAAKGAVIGYDDLGRKIVLPKVPERIVVLSGSPIDAIFELGAGDKIVGVVNSIVRSYPETCRRYPAVLEKERVGRFNDPNIEKIISINPDLIIPYASSDYPGKYTAIFEKRELPFAAFTTVENLAFGLEQIRRLGILLGKEKEAEILTGRIKKEIDELSQEISSRIESRPLVYYWWGERNGTYGRRAAINELIELAGGVNLARDFDRQYMELSPEYVISRDPDVIVISYWQENQKETRIKEITRRPGFSQVKAVKNNRIYTLNGHSFHTPVRFAEVVQNLARFIHPELFSVEKIRQESSAMEKIGAAERSTPRRVVVTDALKRRVEIELPLKKIVTVNTASAIILRALGVDIENKVVGVTTYITENPRFWPKLKNKPAIRFKNLSYEMLAELKPQLIFLYKTSSPFTNEEKLKSLGIKWIYLDCFDPGTLDNDIRTLGLLFGKEKEAKKLISWYRQYDELISARIKNIRLQKRFKIFYYQYPDINLAKGIYNTINKTASSHPLLEKAGGNNLAADLLLQDIKVSPEWIVENNPDVIIAGVLGKSFSGYNAEESKTIENMRSLGQRLANDKALKKTDAVKNERVFLLAQDIKQGPSYVIGLAYMAKYLYPEMFEDIKPETIAREYYETWCGLPYRGVYVYPPFEPAIVTAESSKKKTGQTARMLIDSAGRKIDIPQPVKRIAGLHTSSCRELCLLQLEDKVVGVTEYLLDDPDMYPRLMNKPNIGSVYSPNYELIVENSPDVLIMPTAMQKLQPVLDKLEPLGIKVVALDLQPRKGASAYEREDYYDRELKILGRIFGKEKRAHGFIEWRRRILKLIEDRTKDVEKVCVLGINSVSSVLKKGSGFTVWGGNRIIELAGGKNIAAGLSEKEVSGEWILEQNPEVIIMVSYRSKEGLGYSVTDNTQVKKSLNEIAKHKVFAKTEAAQKGRIYLFGYYGTASGGQTSLGALYLAKRLYPKRFEDVDPQKYHKEYFERWFNVKYQGVWFYP